MADIDYNEVFELEGIDGENMQEVAEPVASTKTGSEKESHAEKIEQIEPPLEKPAAQLPEEKAKYTNIHRKDEAEARRHAEKEVEGKLRKIGMINPETDQPVKDREEYEEVRKTRLSQEHHEFMKNNNMDEKQYYEFVGALPEVRAARVAQERAVNVQVQAQINDDLRQVHEIDPTVNSLDDLKQTPTYEKIVDLVKRGNCLVDAFKLANFDTLTRSAADKGKQAALNRMRGKAHMTTISRRQGGAMVQVPDQVMNQYRIFNPNATEEEIQRHYNNEQRKGQ